VRAAITFAAFSQKHRPRQRAVFCFSELNYMRAFFLLFFFAALEPVPVV
jgi:hypothetical protein